MVVKNVCLFLIVIFIYNVSGKPSFSLFQQFTATFPGLKGFKNKWNEFRSNDGYNIVVKPYSGFRVSNESIRMVYYNEQTIAVAEIGPGKLLLNCELIEVVNPDDAVRTLRNLRSVSMPLEINFMEMLKLMEQCQLIGDSLSTTAATTAETTYARFQDTTSIEPARSAYSYNNPFSLFSGIVPGTKWCGTGDIATNYHDLGSEPSVDKCCRTHDICPVKIKGFRTRYNITNDSLYTKSHCLCDDVLFDCLKESNTSTAQLIGNIYFNIIQIPCIEETGKGMVFRRAKNLF